ncbi:hypothetical protein ACP70R_020863 [Stipagrostis hirtigluma subsp. patula]
MAPTFPSAAATWTTCRQAVVGGAGGAPGRTCPLPRNPLFQACLLLSFGYSSVLGALLLSSGGGVPGDPLRSLAGARVSCGTRRRGSREKVGWLWNAAVAAPAALRKSFLVVACLLNNHAASSSGSPTAPCSASPSKTMPCSSSGSGAPF